MKNIVRLVFFFCCAFIFILFVFTVIDYFHVRSAGLTSITLSGSFFREFVLSFCARLPPTLYLTILINLSYAARREISRTASMFCVFVLAAGFIALGWLFIVRTDDIRLPPARDKTITFGARGLVLVSDNGSNGAMALLDGPREYPRVVVLPDGRAEYREARNRNAAGDTAPPVNPLFFRSNENAFMDGIMEKFHMVALKFEMLAASGLMDFMIYAGSLIVLLVSIRLVMDASSWHLANLLLGGVFFGGILYFEAFIDTIQVQNLISVAVKGVIPKKYISPTAFCLAAFLFISVAVFVHGLSKRGQKKGSRYA